MINKSIWEKKYKATTDKTPEDTFKRVAKAVAQGDSDLEINFYNQMHSLKFIPGGRILAYAGSGKKKATLSNCYVMGKIDDSMEGIMTALHESAITMKSGGGIGLNFSTLRPYGSRVEGTGSVSSGPVSFMEMWNSMSRTISGVGDRKGAMIAVLNIDHPDIEKFIGAKANNTADHPVLEKFNISVGITDAFMKAVEADTDWELVFGEIRKTIRGRELWETIVKNAWAKAEPGVLFLDNINKLNNLWYCEKIDACNPCLTGDTLIATDKGWQPIETLIGTKPLGIINFNPEDGQTTHNRFHNVFLTGVKPVFKLTTKEGFELKATADHKILTTDGWRAVSELKHGDKIVVSPAIGCFGTEGTYEEGVRDGWYVADGCKGDKGMVLSFYDKKQELAPPFSRVLSRPIWESKNRNCTTIVIHEPLTKNEVVEGLFRRSRQYIKGFLQSLFTADGTVNYAEKGRCSLRLTSTDLNLLKRVQILLLGFAIYSRIYQNRREAQIRQLPDGNGGYKDYQCQAYHELVISRECMSTFAKEIGLLLPDKFVKLHQCISGPRGCYKTRWIAHVDSAEFYGTEPVYDFVSPGFNSGIANGLVVHNCGEQPLPPYGACTLGSINLTRFVIDPFGSPRINYDDLIQTVSFAVRFLDNTIDINYYPIPAQKVEAEQKRRIGLGIMGLGSMLAMLKVRYGSEESLAVVETIFRTIRDTAYTTSIELAKEKGSFPLFDKEKYLQGEFIKRLPEKIQNSIKEYGIRNSHLLTIAPTGSISQLAGNVSSGVEPIYSLEYIRKNYNEEISTEDYAWKMYKKLGYPDGKEPSYFVTAHELSWKEHLRIMAKCQEFVDASISKTVNVPEKTSVEELYEVYYYAWSNGLKGCTIYREGSLDVEILKKGSLKPQHVHAVSGERPYKLEGRTYKVKPPESKHAYYLTFTHQMVDGKKIKPFELFINTKNPFVEEWVKALGRLISSVFRNVDDPTFLVDELKEIIGKTGFWSAQRRKYVPSLIAEFGEVMRDYFEEIGLIEPEPPVEVYADEADTYKKPHLTFCHVCGQQAAIFEEGCLKCLACGYNKCG